MNCTSWKQKSKTSPLSSKTLKDPEKPILPQFVIFKLSYLVGPSWGEIIGLSWTHLMRIWEQTQILAREMSPWLSFGWNVTRNWGWLGSLFYFEKTSGGLWFQTRPNGMMQPVNDALIQRQSINSCFFLVQSTQVWWAGRNAFIKGGENNTSSVTGRKMFSFRGMRRLFAFMLWIRQH